MNDNLDGFAEPTEINMRRFTASAFPKTPILPAPLIVRHACVEESGRLAQLLGRAYPTETWETAGTENELFHDESVIAPLVVVQEQRILATATLQIHSDNPDCGRLRWVTTEQDRRREGLAQTLVINVLKAAANEGCQEVRLSTTSDLLGAISMYLKLGFEPVATIIDEEIKVWERLYALLSDVSM